MLLGLSGNLVAKKQHNDAREKYPRDELVCFAFLAHAAGLMPSFRLGSSVLPPGSLTST